MLFFKYCGTVSEKRGTICAILDFHFWMAVNPKGYIGILAACMLADGEDQPAHY
jgi:hypothetical protein